MCQEQFEKEVQAEAYPYWKVESNAEKMAEAIAEDSIRLIRRSPASPLNGWLEGRVCAAALIYPNTRTLSAKNEARFLAGQYAYRVRGML